MPKRKAAHGVAFHEAGHAVIAFHEDIQIRGISIRPEGDTLGMLTVRHPRWFRKDLNAGDGRPRVLAHAIKLGVVLFAGPAAERHFIGWYNHRGADDDYKAVGQLAAHLTGTERQRRALIKWLRVTADDLVFQQEREIRAVAEAVTKRVSLSADEVAEILSSASGY
jgi:hypothetical protein